MHIVLDFGGAQGNEHIVMAVMMHQSGGVRRDFHFEHAYEWIFQDEMMVRFGGDLNFGYRGGQQNGGTDNQ